MEVLAINLVDRADKWKSLNERFFYYPIQHSPGVNLKVNPNLYQAAISKGWHPNTPLLQPGCVGVGLAHMSAWETVIKKDTIHLILEDDASPKDKNWKTIVEKHIQFLNNDFDILLMNALRPPGKVWDIIY